jgi:large subunit ribosomal protein L10
MARPEKERLVQELTDKLSQKDVTILTDYTGTGVQAVTELRKNFRENSVEYHVYKNTLARIAINNAGHEALLEHINGPTGYVFSDDPVAPAKILVDFMKNNPTASIKCGLLDGQMLDVAQIKAIAILPPKDALIAQLLGQLMAPVTGLVNVLSGPARNLVYALEEIRKQKEAA